MTLKSRSRAALARIHAILEGPPSTRPARAAQGGIQLLILLNVMAIVLASIPAIGTRYWTLFAAFEAFSLAVFSAEYLLRLAACTTDERYRRPVLGRLRFAVTPLALVDLLAVLPAYLPLVAALDLRVLRAVRMLRLFRVLKLGRYSESVRSIGLALRDSGAQIATVLFGLAIVLVLGASLVYYAERDVQPEAFGSIPAAAWWAIVTLTTVGYGDMAPITLAGKLAAGVVAVMGIGLFALPAGILGSAFLTRVQGAQTCPHCGREIDRS